ncbi:uncharacterized protein FIBRA_09624 [Fibroporia radiculosa]|uniref:NAD(P)-binding protein n=1 Tax=Fibroporia radiculosa TaxID=599839 RepID=J4ICC1_9APHY|nr:uncharacterized protein FIBRA_09624 [Fibroporia radiculosa]CCM06151.1 predicted protein [Fibroporia radiculosa]
MPSHLITGASRGIGLGLVTELLRDPQNYVIAGARDPAGSKHLHELDAKYGSERLAIVQLDVTDAASVTRAVPEVEALLKPQGGGLDSLINNAGTACQALCDFDEINTDLAEEEFRINTVGSLRVTRAFLPMVRKGQWKKITFITSILGSLELAPEWEGLSNSYAISKAGLNMLARLWGARLRSEGITIILMHPGWVATELAEPIEHWMSKNHPEVPRITPDQCATGAVRVIKEAGLQETVQYYQWNGKMLPL